MYLLDRCKKQSEKPERYFILILFFFILDSIMTVIPVEISEIRQETPTVRVLKIDLLNQDFKYKPGQWIDCYIDIDKPHMVAGYSITSSPTLKGFIELAIKISGNPVTNFIHKKAIVGDTLYIDGGYGEIFYEPIMGDKVVLAGAGIGITPLISILRFIDESTEAKVTLFQSASTFSELIYYNELKARSKLNHRIKYYPTITRENPPKGVDRGRINEKLLEKYDIDTESLFFLSGPGEMIPELSEYLIWRGVDKEKIMYEVWW
jgi:ferredoxin-NADP reductase